MYVRKRGVGKQVVMFALEPGYDPREDDGQEAADQIVEYLRREV